MQCDCIGQDEHCCHHPSLPRILAAFVTVPCPASSAIILQIYWMTPTDVFFYSFSLSLRKDDHCNHFIRNSICGNKNVDKHFLSGSHFMSIFCHPRSWEIYFASRRFAYTERKKKKKDWKIVRMLWFKEKNSCLATNLLNLTPYERVSPVSCHALEIAMNEILRFPPSCFQRCNNLGTLHPPTHLNSPHKFLSLSLASKEAFTCGLHWSIPLNKRCCAANYFCYVVPTLHGIKEALPHESKFENPGSKNCSGPIAVTCVC